MAAKVLCPDCGAPLPFRGAVPYIVCAYCHSLLVRRDATLASIGKVAAVPEDMSPLMLGTTGYFETRRFTLIGRVRKTWEAGSWNEWCALFDDMRVGWLAEVQGEYVMTFEIKLEALIGDRRAESLKQLKPGDVRQIAGNGFQVSDCRTVSCVGAEGELKDGSGAVRPMVSIDLFGPEARFATIEIGEEEIELFLGVKLNFAQCRFGSLRVLEGWRAPAAH